MFWKFHLLATSNINNLLSKKDVTLRELMDEDDILQECKALNLELVNFLVQTDNMEELIKLITVEPPSDVEEQVRFKYPNAACELLTSDVGQINDTLAGNEELVNKLYAFLEGDKPLNPLLASFFSKVMGLLITRKSEMIFEFLKSKNDFVGRLLYHIGTSAVMDLLLRLITCIESPETRRNVIEWLSKEKIVAKLVDSIVPAEDEDIHCNAAQSLCDIVRLGREQFIQQHDTSEPDPLLLAMEQEETVAQLLSRMFDSDKNESVLVNGLCVIHTLLEVRRQGTDPSDQLPNGETDHLTMGISNVIAAIIPRLKDFHDLLVNPPKQRYNTMPTSVGILEPPLGNTRLQVAKLITALVGANVSQVNVELASLGTIPTLLDLYFKYEWNNFVHTQVEQCLLIILNNCPVEIGGELKHPLLTQLFTEYNLVQQLLVEWDKNEQRQKTAGGKRSGFMGHLTKMANSISGLVEKSEADSMVKELFNGLSQDVRDKWEDFVVGSLAEVNRKNAIELMRSHPLASSSEDDDGDFKDIPFPQDASLQQAFSDYQLQQMTSNFIDQFGFSEEEFAEHDEKIEAVFSSRISNINADIQAHGINQRSTTLFEQICNERIKQFDNDDSDEDFWEAKPMTFDKVSSHARLERLQKGAARCNSSDEESTDSGEEQTSPVRRVQRSAEQMDIDHADDLWLPETNPQSALAAMDTTSSQGNKSSAIVSDPSANATPVPSGTTQHDDRWADFASVPTQSEGEHNWADFTSFSDFESLPTQGLRSSSPAEMDTTEYARRNPYVVSADNDNQDKESSGVTLSVTQTLPGSGDIFVQNVEKDIASSSEPDMPSQSHNLSAENGSLNSSSLIVDIDNSPLVPESTSPDLPHSTEFFSVSEGLSSVTDSENSSTSESADANSLESGAHPGSIPLTYQTQADDGSYLHEVSLDEPTTTQAVPESVAPTESHPEVSDRPQNNQSFQASSGLCGDAEPVAATCPISSPLTQSQDHGSLPATTSPPPADVPPAEFSSAPLTDGDLATQDPGTTLTMDQKIELARAQAKEALGMYDEAVAVSENGPV